MRFCGHEPLEKALFLIPCSSEKIPEGDNFPWSEIHSNQIYNKFQFLDNIRFQMTNFYSSLKVNEGLECYRRYDSNTVRQLEKRKKAWEKNLNIPVCRTKMAIERYSGKLYSSLDFKNKNKLKSGMIDNVLIVSALMGIIAPTDMIPDYELMMTDKSPNNRIVWKFWRENLAKDEVTKSLQHIFSKFNYIYCLMSNSTGYVSAVSEILPNQNSYYIVCGKGQENPRLWGRFLNDALSNGVNSIEEIEDLTEKYNCTMESVSVTKKDSERYLSVIKEVRNMGNLEKILEFLETKNKGYDDDKLSIELGIEPRQQVNQICNRLASQKKIIRVKYNGKIHNFPNNELWRTKLGSVPDPDSGFTGNIPPTVVENYPIGIPTYKFEFIREEKIKDLLNKDWEEAQKAFQNELYKSTIVLCGAILESLLIDALSYVENDAKSIYRQKYPQYRGMDTIKDWKFFQLIEISKNIEIISSNDAEVSNIVKNFRNLIHHYAQIEGGLQANSYLASTAINLLTNTYNNISEWHNKKRTHEDKKKSDKNNN